MFDAAARHGELLAVLDDDELPEPRWLDELLECRRRTGAPIVTGPVLPRFEAAAPGWIVQGGFFDLATYDDLTILQDGITGNAMFHLPTIVDAGLRFDDRFGRTGGEDQLFFRQAARRGLDIRYSSQATVFESVPTERANLGFLARRELRKGNTLGLLARDHPELGDQPARRVLAAAKWLTVGATAALLGAVTGRDIRLKRGLLSGVRAAGMIGGLCGWRYIAY